MPAGGAEDSELRRRAAWLLVALVVAAGLIVLVMTTVLRGGSGSGGSGGALAPDHITATGPTGAVPSRSEGGAGSGTTDTGGPGNNGGGSGSAGSSASATGSTTCPGSTACILPGDGGNATAAVAALLAKDGRPAVPVTVTPAAQQCALSRGDTCQGGWAETELSTPDGALAVQKISSLGKLTSTSYASLGIGWAFDPGSKTYYFATIRQG